MTRFHTENNSNIAPNPPTGPVDAVSAILSDAEPLAVALFEAVSANNIECVTSILTTFPQALRCRYANGNTPLHAARSVEMINLLLQRGSDMVFSFNNSIKNPLYAICAPGRKFPRLQLAQAIAILLAAGACPRNNKAGENKLLAHFAENNFCPEFLALLESPDALSEEVDKNGFNAEAGRYLRLFVARNRADVVSALCDVRKNRSRRADPNSVIGEDVRTSPLFMAVASKAELSLAALIAAGADPNLFDARRNSTALVYAVSTHARGCVDALVAAGAEKSAALELAIRMNRPDLKGRLGDRTRYDTLSSAASNGSVEDVALLLKDAKNSVYVRPSIYCAMSSGYLKCAELLFDAYGGEPDQLMLGTAAELAEPDLVRFAAARIRDSARRAVMLNNAAFLSVKADRPDNLRALLEAGASPDSTDASGIVPIFWVSSSLHNSGCMLELLVAGVKPFEIYPENNGCFAKPQHKHLNDMALAMDAAGIPRSRLRDYFC